MAPIYRIINRQNSQLVFMGSYDEVMQYLGTTRSKTYEILLYGTHQYKIYDLVDIYKYKGSRGTREELGCILNLQPPSIRSAMHRGTAKLVGHTFKPRGVDGDTNEYALYSGDDCLFVGYAYEIIDLNLFSCRSFYDILKNRRPGCKYQIIKIEED